MIYLPANVTFLHTWNTVCLKRTAFAEHTMWKWMIEYFGYMRFLFLPIINPLKISYTVVFVWYYIISWLFPRKNLFSVKLWIHERMLYALWCVCQSSCLNLFPNCFAVSDCNSWNVWHIVHPKNTSIRWFTIGYI